MSLIPDLPLGRGQYENGETAPKGEPQGAVIFQMKEVPSCGALRKV